MFAHVTAADWSKKCLPPCWTRVFTDQSRWETQSDRRMTLFDGAFFFFFFNSDFFFFLLYNFFFLTSENRMWCQSKDSRDLPGPAELQSFDSTGSLFVCLFFNKWWFLLVSRFIFLGLFWQVTDWKLSLSSSHFKLDPFSFYEVIYLISVS